MRGTVTIIFMLAVTTLIGLFGFTSIVAPIAKGALILIPAIFTISLIIGFAARRQRWFH